MDDPNVHEVNQIEHHYLPTCPCEACRQERLRRGQDKPASSNSRIKHISMDAAEVLFGIPRHPSGSLAKELAEAAESSSKNSRKENNG